MSAIDNNKNIKDYLHLYLGAKVLYLQNDGSYKDFGTILNFESGYNLYSGFKTGQLKISLRPLSDMTEEECDEFGIASDGGEYLYDNFEPDAVYGGWQADISISAVTERINEMRKRFFDCDGLIESGLAIDATALKNNL